MKKFRSNVRTSTIPRPSGGAPIKDWQIVIPNGNKNNYRHDAIALENVATGLFQLLRKNGPSVIELDEACFIEGRCDRATPGYSLDGRVRTSPVTRIERSGHWLNVTTRSGDVYLLDRQDCNVFYPVHFDSVYCPEQAETTAPVQSFSRCDDDSGVFDDPESRIKDWRVVIIHDDKRAYYSYLYNASDIVSRFFLLLNDESAKKVRFEGVCSISGTHALGHVLSAKLVEAKRIDNKIYVLTKKGSVFYFDVDNISSRAVGHRLISKPTTQTSSKMGRLLEKLLDKFYSLYC